jgi:hypothetical protein
MSRSLQPEPPDGGSWLQREPLPRPEVCETTIALRRSLRTRSSLARIAQLWKAGNPTSGPVRGVASRPGGLAEGEGGSCVCCLPTEPFRLRMGLSVCVGAGTRRGHAPLFPAPLPAGLIARVGSPEAPEDRCPEWTEEGIRAGYAPFRGWDSRRIRPVSRTGFAQGTLQSEGGRRRLTWRRKAGGRVPGRGRSLIGALHGFLRPRASGPGPEV